MENFQRQLRRASEDPTAQDPLWDLTPASEDLPEGDVATFHLGEEPMNLEIYSQTNNFLAEYFPEEEEENHSSLSEDEDSITSSDVYVETDSGETTYMSDPELNSEDELIAAEDELIAAEDQEYDQRNDLDDSQADEVENAEIRAERRHGIRLFSAIESWMEAQFIMRLEEEMNHIKDNPGNITWTDDRLLIFKIICKNDIRETLQQLREGSILCPLSQTNLEE